MGNRVTELRYTLLSDGSSDRVLMPLLSWALREQRVLVALSGEWADLRVLRNPPEALAARIEAALDLYPCDLLFVHRDTEGATLENRRHEITTAIDTVFDGKNAVPVVCVIPRRMAEAWLLFDEEVIRSASGNPKGTVQLDLPRINRLEGVADPKQVLYDLLRTASEHKGRKLQSLPVRRLVHRVSELLEEFSPLRVLPAFVAFEAALAEIVARQGWRSA
jgi:hypothetical protein